MFNIFLRIFACLDRSSIIKLINLQVFNLFIGTLNIISAVLIAQFVILISGYNLKLENVFLEKTLNYLNFLLSSNLLLYVSIALVFFYVLTILLNLVLNYFNLKWMQDLNVSFQKKLYNYYLEKKWIFHADNSSKEIISKIHTDTSRLSNTIILPFLDLFSNLIISSIIITAIFVVDLKVALISLALFISFYSFFYFLFKKKLRYAGDIVSKTYPIYFKSLFEGFTSIKDVILFDKKDYFKNSFSNSVNKLKEASIIQSYLLQIPRNLIEAIFFTLLIGIIFLSINYYGYEFAEIGAIIAFYGICAIKIIPALQKIFKSMSSINSNLSAFENIENDLIKNKGTVLKTNNIEKQTNEKIDFKNSIKLENVSFSYPTNEKAGIFNVNMNIPYGSKVGIVGKTGSGKSTLLDIILGFIYPSEGNIKVDNQDINKENVRFWQKNLSYVPQNFFIYEGDIENNISFSTNKNLIDKEKLLSSMHLAELKEFVGNEKINVGENGKKLSGGQKQRVGIARAIYKNSEIIVLDEATNSLDSITEKNILKNLEDNKRIKTLIIVSHRFETLKMCDKFFFIKNGKVEELMSFNDLTEKYKK